MNTRPFTLFKSVILIFGCLTWDRPVLAEDLDEDGVDDALERMLIDRHRPHLYYDRQEDNWPSSVTWYLQHSGLVTTTNVIYDFGILANDPLKLLDAACASQTNGTCVGLPSSTIQYPHPQPLIGINFNTDFEGGEGPIPVGTYGHVVPLTGPITYTNREPLEVGPDDLLIQYWQFFPFSDSQAPFGTFDHEGDWLYLDVYVRRQPPHTLRHIVYHHHGDGRCAPDVIPGGVGTIVGFDEIEGTPIIGQVFVPLPPDGIPKAYLDEGSHEWWALPCDSGGCDCFGADPHDGLGVNYRTQNVLNLGERYAPMPGVEPQLILFYNGTWGLWDSPAPPAFQFYPLPPLVVGYVDANAPAWADAGLGSRYHPFLNLPAAKIKVEEGLVQLQATGTAGRILMRPGNYSGSYEFNKPMTLEVWGNGVVTISQ